MVHIQVWFISQAWSLFVNRWAIAVHRKQCRVLAYPFNASFMNIVLNILSPSPFPPQQQKEKAERERKHEACKRKRLCFESFHGSIFALKVVIPTCLCHNNCVHINIHLILVFYLLYTLLLTHWRIQISTYSYMNWGEVTSTGRILDKDLNCKRITWRTFIPHIQLLMNAWEKYQVDG